MRDIIKLAGGFTRNIDQNQLRLLKADRRVLHSKVESKDVEPGDAVPVPRGFRAGTHQAGQPQGTDTARPHLERQPQIKQPNALQVGCVLSDLASGL